MGPFKEGDRIRHETGQWEGIVTMVHSEHTISVRQVGNIYDIGYYAAPRFTLVERSA